MPSELDYIQNILVPELMRKYGDETFIEHKIKCSTAYMTSMYRMLLITEKHGEHKKRYLFIKLMKGKDSTRESSEGDIKFRNEIFAYSKLLPTFQKILDEARITRIRAADWIAHVHFARHGYVEGLSVNIRDNYCVMVLDNLVAEGYLHGAKVFLKADELLSMCELLGQYHGLSYATRLKNRKLWDELKNEIKSSSFIYDNYIKAEQSDRLSVLYRVAFDRFFDYYDRTFHEGSLYVRCEGNFKLMNMIEKLRSKYFDEPNLLLEFICKSIAENPEDERFAVILHGDYHRNNVLFHHSLTHLNPNELPKEKVKMLDFKKLHYGTPAIDLSFFMYMHSTYTVRDILWSDLIRTYHKQMLDTLTSILKANIYDENRLKDIEEVLAKYTYDHFQAHFARYAFYGVMMCMHFWPWILCSSEEFGEIAAAFENNMHSEEFHRLAMSVGGEELNELLLSALRHACNMGFMDSI